MLTEKLQRLTFTHISLALVGLMWVLPFLNYHHQYPLTTFDQEWWSALLGVLALSSLLGRDYWRQPKIPRIVQLPAALIALALLQSALGSVAYFDQALLYLMYFLLAMLLMLLGAQLKGYFGIEKLALVLALFLLAGAEMSALIGMLQHYRWHTFLDTVVVVKVSSGVYGNLAQPNHFANYIALGLISLGLLFQLRKLPLAFIVLLAIPLLFVMSLSGSRSSWLYLAMMIVLAWWGARSQPSLRPLLRYCLWLFAGFAIMLGIVQLPFMKGASAGFDVMNRMFSDTASGSVRLYLWHEAWMMFRQSPWIGAGFGQFAWQHFQMGPALLRTNITGLYNNAHNLIFQLAAESGMAGLVVLFAAAGAWLHGIRRTIMGAAHWWGYAILGVLAIHSLLEYPLWYCYFLAVASILLGALDETHYRLELHRVSRMTLAAMIMLGVFSLIQLKSSYQLLKETLAIKPVAGSYERSRDGLISVHGVLSPYADMFMSSYIEVSGDRIEAKLALNSRVIRFLPIAPVVYRQSYLLAQDGQAEPARRAFEQAVWSYPDNTEAHRQLIRLAEKDPAHFSSLLEFALKTEQGYARAIHNN